MPLTLAEVEEALCHAQAVPIDQRGTAWTAYVDSLLDQRQTTTEIESRVSS